MVETTWTPDDGKAAGDSGNGEAAGTALPTRPFAGSTGVHTKIGGGGGGPARRLPGGASAASALPGDGWGDYVLMVANLIQAASTTDEQSARLVEELVKTSSRVYALIGASLVDVAVIMRAKEE